MKTDKIITQYLTDVSNIHSVSSYVEIYKDTLQNIDLTVKNEILEPQLNNYCGSLENAIERILEYIKTHNVNNESYFVLAKRINILLSEFQNKIIEKGFKIENGFENEEIKDMYKRIALRVEPNIEKKYLPHAYELEKKFKKFIKIKAVEPKVKKNIIKKSDFIFEENPYPDIFTGIDNKNYLIFKSFTEKYIIDRYNDFSFIIQKMKNEKRITRISHFDLMKWLRENNFISENTFETFIKKGTFTTKALQKAERQNSYDLIIIDIDKRYF